MMCWALHRCTDREEASQSESKLHRGLRVPMSLSTSSKVSRWQPSSTVSSSTSTVPSCSQHRANKPTLAQIHMHKYTCVASLEQ